MRGTHEGNCAMHSKPAEKEQAHTPRGKAAEHRKKCPRRLPLFFMPPKPHRNADRSHSGRAEADALHMIGPHSGVYAGRARHRRTERQQNKCPKPYGIAARIGKQSGHILRPSKASGRPHPPGRTRPAQDPGNRQGCFAPSAGQAAPPRAGSALHKILIIGKNALRLLPGRPPQRPTCWPFHRRLFHSAIDLSLKTYTAKKPVLIKLLYRTGKKIRPYAADSRHTA